MFSQQPKPPPPQKKLANIDANQFATTQAAVPAPYFFGRQRLGITFIAPPYNMAVVAIKEKVGKSQEATTGNDYYGDYAAIFACVGRRWPVDTFYRIIRDSEITWDGVITRDSDFYEPITVEDMGVFRIRWGYYNQTRDAVLVPIGPLPLGADPRDPTTWPNGDRTLTMPGEILGHYDDHPTYRDQAGLFAGPGNIKWGQNRETQPSLEVEVARGTPYFGGTNIGYDDRGVNPVGPIYELATCDVTGLGMADTDLYQPGFTAVRDYLIAQDLKISGKLTEQIDFTAFLDKVFRYFDGFARMRGAQLDIGYWKQGLTTAQITALPVIGSDDLTGEPDLPALGYPDDTATLVNVKFSDRDHYFNSDSRPWQNPGLRRQLGYAKPVEVDAEWITDGDLASAFAAQYGAAHGRPAIAPDGGGTIAVKVEVIEAIEDAASGTPIEGQLVKVDIASLGEEIVFRVLSVKYLGADSGSCELTVSGERSIWPSIFIQPPPKKIGNFVVKVPAIANHKVVELPSGLKTSGSLIQLSVLAQRPQENIVGFHFNSSLDDVTYDQAPAPSTFATFGKLHIAYPNTTADIDLTVGMQFTLFGVDPMPDHSGLGFYDYVLLCFVDGEIMSVGEVTALGGGIYKALMWRGRYGTTKATHAVNAPAYFILRATLTPIGNKNFQIGNTIHIKLQPFDAHQTFDLADVTSFTYVIGGGAVGDISGLSLATDYKGTSKGLVDSFITADWDYIGDQDISSFDMSWKRSTDTVWSTRNVGKDTTGTVYLLEQGVVYSFRIRAVNEKGEPGDWSALVNITSADAPALPLPTFNDDYTGDAVVSGASYDDVTAFSLQAQAPTGKKIRYQLAAVVTPTSPFWPAHPPATGDGTGTNMAGFIQSNGLGPDQHFGGGPPVGPYKHTTVWHVCVVDPAHPTVLGPQAVVTSTYIRVASESWPKTDKPFYYRLSGDTGTLGSTTYQIRSDCTDDAATMYHSASGLPGTWFVYTPGVIINVGVGLNHYWQAKRYISPDWDQLQDSDILIFANTTSTIPNQGGAGGGGGGSRIQPV